MAAKIRATPGPKDFDRLFRVGTLNGCSEAEILARFVESRDEYAFESMMLRHGPMVLRTCRALLADPHDADDAFQATFLVLSRRAGSIRNAELLGPWLHRVARRASARALARSSRIAKHEHAGTDALASLPAPSTLPHPDRAAIHEAIDHLPESYRRVIILCDLEGHSHAEAAARLGCPIGTVKGRQSRARTLLRRRLTRLGLAPSALLTSPLFTLPARAFSVPRALVHRTSRAAAAFASGGVMTSGTVPTAVLSLTTGVLTGMIATQIKSFALVGLLAIGLGTTGLAALRPTHDADGVPGVVSTTAQRTGGDRPDNLDRLAPGHPAASPADEVPPEADDPIAPYLGKWTRLSTNGKPLPKGQSITMELRRARQELADALEWEGEVLIAAFKSWPGDIMIHHQLVILDLGAVPDRFVFLPTEVLTEALSRFQGDRPVAELGYGGRSRIEGDRLTIHLGSGENRPDSLDKETGSLTTLYVYRKVAEPGGVAGGVPGVDPTPAEDAEGDRPDDRGRHDPGHPAEDPLAPLLGTWRRTSANRIPSPEGATALLNLRRADPAKLSGLNIGLGEPILCTSVLSPVGGESGTLNAQSLAIVLGDGNSGHFDSLSLSSFAPADDGGGPDHVGIASPLNKPGIYKIEGDTLTLLTGSITPASFDEELKLDMKLEVYERSPDPLPSPPALGNPGDSYGFAPGTEDKPAADTPQDPTNPDIDALLGTWITTSYTLFGNRLTNQAEGGPDNTALQIRRLEGEPDEASDPDDPSIPLRLVWAEQTQKSEGVASPFGANRIELIARFDPSSEPPSVTIIGEEDRLTLGIYRLEGDRLILHLGERLPKSWSRDPSNQSMLMTLRRLDIDQILSHVSLDNVRRAISGKTPTERRPTEPLPIDQELDEILARWEQASGKIETLYATFEQIDEMKIIGETKTYKGTAYLKRPNLALLQLDKQTGDEEGETLVFDRRILINGDEFVEFDGTTRQITVLPLARDDQGRAIEGGALPFRLRMEDIKRLLPRLQPPLGLDFLFGMNAEDFKRRYRIKLIPPTQDDTVRITLSPKNDADRNSFSIVVLILDAPTLRPRSIHVLAPNGQDKQTYLINDLKANVTIEPELFAWNSARAQQARNNGWRVIPRPEPEHEPEPDPLTGLVPLPTQVTEDLPSRDDPSPRNEDEPRSIDRRLSTLEAKLDRLLELLDAPDR